jgi:myo-inositol-1(or 4)-monophosphatase
LQSAAPDLLLLEAAAREAGALARASFGKEFKIFSKGAAGPVTEVDYAVDKLLMQRLRTARTDYGWLSEETPDTPDRLTRKRVFVLDPIDGTSAFVAQRPQFAIVIGVVENGRAIAGAIYNPIADKMYLGGDGVAATMNGDPIRVTDVASLEGARLIGKRRFFDDKHWPRAWPEMKVAWRDAIALRMALVARGGADGVVLPGFKHEWDICAGAAILEAAGGRVTDPWGEPLVFNQPTPRAPGVVAAGPALHALLIEQLASLPDPRGGARVDQDTAT